MKEVVDLRWCNQDCVLIAAELYEEFNTKVHLNIYFRIPHHSYREDCRFNEAWSFRLH